MVLLQTLLGLCLQQCYHIYLDTCLKSRWGGLCLWIHKSEEEMQRLFRCFPTMAPPLVPCLATLLCQPVYSSLQVLVVAGNSTLSHLLKLRRVTLHAMMTTVHVLRLLGGWLSLHSAPLVVSPSSLLLFLHLRRAVLNSGCWRRHKSGHRAMASDEAEEYGDHRSIFKWLCKFKSLLLSYNQCQGVVTSANSLHALRDLCLEEASIDGTRKTPPKGTLRRCSQVIFTCECSSRRPLPQRETELTVYVRARMRYTV
jgi:hypothetical protein